MRRSVLLVLVVAVAALIFAPVAVAQDDNSGSGNRGPDDRDGLSAGLADPKGSKARLQ